MNKTPKISIITACYNGKSYIADCIQSVKGQTYADVEHIIIDGGSTDGTLDIIKEYEGQYNMKWISEPDHGMYDAIQKGFAMATGDIFAWLNYDDMYMPWACELVANVMSKTGIEWCTGIPCHYTDRGVAYNVPRVTPVFPKIMIKAGFMDGRVATFLEQESMFWSCRLWEKSGHILSNYKIAGDFHLWKNFAKYADLYTLDSVISGFRIHFGQKSSDRQKYYSEVGDLSVARKVLARTHIIPIVLLIVSLTNTRLRIKSRKFLVEEDL